jgi:hypothetical protein
VGKRLETMLSNRLRELGLDQAILAGASQVVIFGSCATGLEAPDSDLDVLCVGNGPRFKSHSLDLCWISEKSICEDKWLGSELAGHVARYGIWLSGKDHWRIGTFTSRDAIERKRKRIVSLSRTVNRLWDRLHPIFRSQYNVTIRRELQRLKRLEEQVQIPPTRVLDDEWQTEGHSVVLKFRSSIEQLHAYEGQSNVPSILRAASSDPALLDPQDMSATDVRRIQRLGRA